MKRQLVLLYALVLGILVIPVSSCTNENDQTDPGFGIGTFTATVGGKPWVATAPVAVKTGNRLTITGTSLNPASTIALHINGLTAGTYNMNLFSTNVQPFVYTPDLTRPQVTFIGTAGTIELTRISENRLSGTFNVIATSTNLQITTIVGSFDNVIYRL